jgi:hypothetical protein
MIEIDCFDSYGDSIDCFTQWDFNQELYIKDWQYDYMPIFHFTNTKSDVALVLKGSIESDGRAKTNVPNVLLQESYPIIVYVYYEEENSGKTIRFSKIPVRKRPKPHDYEYVENVEYINWIKLEEEARAFIQEMSDNNEQFKEDYDDAYQNYTSDLKDASDQYKTDMETNVNQFKSDCEFILGSAKDNADRAEEAAEKAETMVDRKLSGKGDNLEYDASTKLLHLTSNGERIGNSIPIITRITVSDDGKGNVYLVF